MSPFLTTITTTTTTITPASVSNDSDNMIHKKATRTKFLTLPFRRQWRHYTINPPDDTHHVIYLGNVLTVIAKGEECLEKPLSLIWNAYSSRKKAEIPMKLTVTRSGLKAETKKQGITEYWSHRITYCLAPSNFPRLFCWVYKHEGKKMKPELRCHAALCKKSSDPCRIAQTLEHFLRAALQEYRREKLCRQNSRINALTIGQSSTGPKRKLMLQTGSLNFRPPTGRSKSSPRLFDIDEESEYPEEQQDENSDVDSLCYGESSVSGDGYCTNNSSECTQAMSIPFSRHDSFLGGDDEKQWQMERLNGKSITLANSLTSEFSSSIESGSSSVCSDDGVQFNDSESPSSEIRGFSSSEKRSERETDTISEESGYLEFDDGFTNTIVDVDSCGRSYKVDCNDDESQFDEQVTAL